MRMTWNEVEQRVACKRCNALVLRCLTVPAPEGSTARLYPVCGRCWQELMSDPLTCLCVEVDNGAKAG